MSATMLPATTGPGAPGTTPGQDVRRSYRGPIAYAVIGLLALLVFGLGAPAGTDSTFRFATSGDLISLPDLVLPSRVGAIALSVIALVLAGVAAWAVRDARRPGLWLPVVFGFVVVVAFLTWAVAGRAVPVTGMLQGTLLLAVPLVFGSLGGVLCERAGVVNIAIEGQLLSGAFLAAVTASVTGSAWAGLVAAPVAGALVSALLALFAIKYLVNQVIVGVVLNVLVSGTTGFLFSTVAGSSSALNSPDRLPQMPIPLLSDIPVLGPVLFDQRPIVYLMYVAVAVIQVALFRTRWGLRVRAVGEHPKAADTVGIKVNRTRVRNVLLGGAVAGLGGAFFTIGSVGAFGTDMTAGQGYIALAAVIFGRWTPKGALAAALLFAFANELQYVLSSLSTPVPSQFLLMAPYVATIFAVAGLIGRSRPPAASGIPYVKG